jgi:RND superfamily putative drug exporter
MRKLGRFVTNHSKWVLFGLSALILASTLWGFQAFSGLKAGGYDDPGADSGRVNQLLKTEFSQHVAEIVIIADFNDDVEAPASQETATKLVKYLNDTDGVVGVTSYYSSIPHAPALRSIDGKAAYFFVDLTSDEKRQSAIAQSLMDHFDAKDSKTQVYSNAKIYVAGWSAVGSEINGEISSGLATAESIAIPVTIILLIFVFGSLVASGLPFLVAGISILGSFFFIWVSTQLTDTSVFAVNLVTGLGLGLGIDYALLIVNRYREERARGLATRDAVVETVATAGRTVFFSGVTVAVVMLGLAFFPQYFLRSFAVGGVSSVLLAVVGAVVVLPALINLLGDKVDKGKVLRGQLTPKDHGIWSSIAKFVMRRPLPVLFVVLLGLGSLLSLAGNVTWGQVDDRILPKTDRVVVASDIMRTRFEGRETSPYQIIAKGASQDQIVEYTIALSKLDHIKRVQSTAGIAQDGVLDPGYASVFADYKKGDYQQIQAIGDVEPRALDGVNLVNEIRKLPNNFGEVWVGGSAALYGDSMAGISNTLPWVALWIIITTLLLLFLFTGSLILPIKAVLLNMVSLGATIGFLTWVFLDGNLKWLIGDFNITGTLDSSSMVLVAVIAFGLSMDYELFLLSRIKEQHDAGLSTTESVSVGLQRSGRIITTAAFVLAVSFFAFVMIDVSIMKMLGLGVAFAILLDATIVRALLVPALMRLFGDLNWWAPAWMTRIYKKLGLGH